MRQLSTFFLLIICFFFSFKPAHSVVVGKIEYPLSIDYTKLSENEISQKALNYYNLAKKNSTNEVEIRALCNAFGAFLTPYTTYADNCGDIYTISMSPSHFCDHLRAAKDFDRLITKMIEKEKQNERILFEKSGKIITDRAHKALGSLLFATMLEESELLSLISYIRLCIATEADKEKLPKVSVGALNFLLAHGLNFSVASSLQGFNSQADIDEGRAEIVKRILSSDKNP